MKTILLLPLIILSFYLSSFSQPKPTGIWLVCTNNDDCSEDGVQLYMAFQDSTMGYLIVMSTGLDPVFVGESHYTIDNNILTTTDTNSTGKIFINNMEMIWLNDSIMHLIEVDRGDTLFLYRDE